MKKFTVSVAAALAMSTFAMAGGDIAPVEPVVEPVVEAVVDDSGFYIGGAYSYINGEQEHTAQYDGYSDYTYEEDWNAIMLQAGYKFNKYVALEGRYWFSIGDATANDGDGDGDYDIEDDLTAWGIYVKPMYPVAENFNIYALLGYANVEIENWDESGFSWGLGAAYSFTENVSVFVDFVRLYDDDEMDYSKRTYSIDSTIDAWNFGVTYKF